jgi:YVTN family beta-propeller protein
MMRKRLALLRARNLPLVSGLAAWGAQSHTTMHISKSDPLATGRGVQRHALFIFVLMLGGLAGCGSSTSGSTPTVTSVPVTPTLPAAPGGTVSATLKSVAGDIDPGYLYGMAADDTAVWVHNSAQGTVVRIDPKTNKLVATIPVGQGLGDVVLGPGAVWVATRDDKTVSRIDPATNRVVATIKLPAQAGFMAVSQGAVWVASKENDTLWKIDPRTNQVVATILVPAGPAWMSFSAGSLWICIHDVSGAD